MTTFEIIATISGIIAVALQAREKILAWPFAIVSVAISAYVFFYAKLYSDFGLHILYILLNVYGWVIWSTRKKSEEEVSPTKLLSQSGILYSGIAVIAGTALLGFTMFNYTDADVPFLDAFTTAGSIVAQYLLAKKYLQNWLLWVIVDIVAVPLYLYKGLYFFSFLFFVYLLICLWGYFSWKKKMDLQ